MNVHREIMGGAQLANEAESLIARYPSLDETEVDRLVDIYRNLNNVDIALMISDDELGPRLESFTRAERHRLRMPLRHVIGLLSPVLLLLLVIPWLVAS